MFFDTLLIWSDHGLLALRIAVGVIFIYHAMPKLKDAKGLASAMGFPAGGVLLLGSVEFLSGLAVITGILLELGALLLAIVMLGALYFKIAKWRVPFWAMDKTGWEFDLLLLAANLTLLTTGGGSLALL
jgi:uncharacterized membrane protein YphA (DoxX/SURF4 family)